MADVAFALHGHFYQPPRENPWTEVVPRQPTAAPFHDWNERITAECYRPNGWARILDDHGRIVAIVDNYEHLSFNVGPTLMSWLDEHAPETYARIVDADRSRSAGHRTGVRPRHPAPVQRPRPAHAGPLGARRLPPPLRPPGRGHVAARDRGRRSDAGGAGRGGGALHHPGAGPDRRGAAPRRPRRGRLASVESGRWPGPAGHGAVAAPRRPGARRRPRDLRRPDQPRRRVRRLPEPGRRRAHRGARRRRARVGGVRRRDVRSPPPLRGPRRGLRPDRRGRPARRGAAPAGRLAGRAPAHPRGAGPRVRMVVRPRGRAVDGGLRLPHRRRGRLEPGVAGPAAGRVRPDARCRDRGVRAARPGRAPRSLGGPRRVRRGVAGRGVDRPVRGRARARRRASTWSRR